MLIPPAVQDELQIHSSRPGADALKDAIDAAWIVVQAPSDAALIRTLRRDIDQGEVEAITLPRPKGDEQTDLSVGVYPSHDPPGGHVARRGVSTWIA